MTDASTTQNATPADTDADFAALALLAGLGGASSDDMRLLKIITNPDYSHGAREGETHLQIAEDYDENMGSYIGGDWEYEVEVVADFLYNHYAAQDDLPDFCFGFNSSASREIHSYDVSIRVGDYPNSLTLSTGEDIKHSTVDREATGLASALAVATALDSCYQALVTKARKHGLLPAPAPVVANAAAALAALDATPEHNDIDVDTLAQVRESLIALLDAQGGAPVPSDG